ncbi:FAD-dependent oxidoreductase [Xylophilus sp.]|uniref:FAD-dependent oxidoreductase n=1 Tax=Xylophilus sp. TaxID=2653893 RepID=UPI0013BAF030|nr:FAD-dependent oxidoreductase [Xylophilus sp.]KAF1043394.1 MAG: D-amino acid dehydrogenase [Xylophilus sp.]
MKIAIVGAGIIGVATAYELSADGHEVTVFERRGAVAEEGSFSGAGLATAAWAAIGPGPASATRQWWRLLRGRSDPQWLGPRLRGLDWVRQQVRAGRPGIWQEHQARLLALSGYGQARLRTLTAALELEHDRAEGHLLLLRTPAERERLKPRLQWLLDAGVRVHALDAAAARAIEPALGTEPPLEGALHFPDDDLGNTRQFALLLRSEAQRRGAEFVFGATVAALSPSSRPGWKLAGDPAPRSFDAVVVCAGAAAGLLLRPLGLRLPLAAVTGHAVNAPVREPLAAPRSAVTEAASGISVSRVGQRIRVAGTSYLGRVGDTVRREALNRLYRTLQDWFPGAATLSAGLQEWQGVRPALPGGVPVIGSGHQPGLWLNLGHGGSGWTTACSSARLLADQIAGRTPEIDADAYALRRLG